MSEDADAAEDGLEQLDEAGLSEGAIAVQATGNGMRPIKVEPVGTRRGSDTPTYDQNPFLSQLVDMRTRAKRVTVSSGKAIIDTGTGEIEDVAEIVQVKQVDSEEFVKIYTSQLRVFFDLSPGAFRMLNFVLTQVQRRFDNDVIILNQRLIEKYFTECSQKPLSRNTYYKAVRELVGKNFLAACAHSDDLFYINPTMFWSGDRVRFVREYVKKRSTAKHDPNQLALFEQQRALGKI